MFALRQKFKDDKNEVMQLLVILVLNALYGELLRKDVLERYECKSEDRMRSEYDGRILDYHKINYGNYIVKLKDDEGMEDEVNTLPLQLAAFILSNSKRNLNNFRHAICGFYTNDA